MMSPSPSGLAASRCISPTTATAGAVSSPSRISTIAVKIMSAGCSGLRAECRSGIMAFRSWSGTVPGCTARLKRKLRVSGYSGLMRIRKLIKRIAADPIGRFDDWRRVDKPFAFLAACFELVEAWKDPRRFVTTLPIQFDATASGIQHLALLSRDEEAARLVNLTGDTEQVRDVYGEVADAVMGKLLLCDDGEQADWWRSRLDSLDSNKLRKVFKRPVMTFAYSVTDHGVAEQLVEVSLETFDERPPPGAAMYLARKIRAACRETLKGPAAVMDYVCRAGAGASRARTVSFVGKPERLSGQQPILTCRTAGTIYLSHGRRRSEFVVADGELPKINGRKVKSSAAPNFVHSLDAAHLARVVNRSVREGIRDVLSVHDCFACLAPHAIGSMKSSVVSWS